MIISMFTWYTEVLVVESTQNLNVATPQKKAFRGA